MVIVTKRRKHGIAEEEKPKRKSKGVGSGNYERKGPIGYALIKERTDAEMRRFVVTPEMQASLDYIADEVILKGRPPKYIESDDPAVDMPTRVFRLISDVSQGMRTVDGCGVMLGCSIDTFYEWQRTHVRFSEACKMGKKMQEMYAASRMSQGIVYPTSLIFTMKNLHNWADRVETSVQFSLKDVMSKFQGVAKPVDWDRPQSLPLQGVLEASLVSQGENIPENVEDAS